MKSFDVVEALVIELAGFMEDAMLAAPVVAGRLLNRPSDDVEAVRASASKVDDPEWLEVDVTTVLDDSDGSEDSEVMEEEGLVITV